MSGRVFLLLHVNTHTHTYRYNSKMEGGSLQIFWSGLPFAPPTVKLWSLQMSGRVCRLVLPLWNSDHLEWLVGFASSSS